MAGRRVIPEQNLIEAIEQLKRVVRYFESCEEAESVAKYRQQLKECEDDLQRLRKSRDTGPDTTGQSQNHTPENGPKKDEGG